MLFYQMYEVHITKKMGVYRQKHYKQTDIRFIGRTGLPGSTVKIPHTGDKASLDRRG